MLLHVFLYCFDICRKHADPALFNPFRMPLQSVYRQSLVLICFYMSVLFIPLSRVESFSELINALMMEVICRLFGAEDIIKPGAFRYSDVSFVFVPAFRLTLSVFTSSVEACQPPVEA